MNLLESNFFESRSLSYIDWDFINLFNLINPGDWDIGTFVLLGGGCPPWFLRPHF